MQTDSDKNNYNPDVHHDTDDQLDSINFDDEDLIEEEFNDKKKKNH